MADIKLYEHINFGGNVWTVSANTTTELPDIRPSSLEIVGLSSKEWMCLSGRNGSILMIQGSGRLNNLHGLRRATTFPGTNHWGDVITGVLAAPPSIDTKSLTFLPQGRLYVCGNSLVNLDDNPEWGV